MMNAQQPVNPITIDNKRHTIWEINQKQRAAQTKYLLSPLQKNNNKAAEMPNMDKKMTMTK